MFVIRRRSTGKIVERGFKNRQEAKTIRNPLNIAHHKNRVPNHNREYYVARSPNHRLGPSK